MRHDANSDFRDASSYRAALRMPLATPNTVAYISVGTGTKNPTFTERYGYTPDKFFGNAQLRPERSRSLAVAVSHGFTERVQMRATAFHDELQDEIDGFVFDALRGGFTARNVDGDSNRDGIELALQLQGDAQTTARIDFTYLHATEPGADGRQDELRRPRYSGRIVIDHTALGDRAHLQIGAAYIGSHDDLDFGALPARRIGLDAYTLLHCTARYQLNARFEMSARIENLSDAHYQDVYGYRTPGRSGYLGLRMAL
jgi:vitamin B12 transporter